MVRVLLHWEIRFECSDRLDAAEFRCCLHYVGCLVLFFPININSFNTLCQRWAALSFFLSTLIDSTHYDRGGLAGRMLERGWSIPPLPPTSIYYFALSITIFYYFFTLSYFYYTIVLFTILSLFFFSFLFIFQHTYSTLEDLTISPCGLY